MKSGKPTDPSPNADGHCTASIKKPTDYRIRQVLQWTAQDPSKSVQELARLLNLSGSRLGHLFRSQVGIDLESFLRNARLQKAADLLRHTELSIKAIAALVGYRHASSFDRGFKKKFELEPADYRRRHRLEVATPASTPILKRKTAAGAKE
jgi:transcriptional regulator GlxA family with amidase domain